MTLGELLGSREPQLSPLPGDDTASRYSVMTLKVIWDLTDTTTPGVGEGEGHGRAAERSGRPRTRNECER